MAARWETARRGSFDGRHGMRVAVGARSTAAMHDDKDGRMASALALGFGSHTPDRAPRREERRRADGSGNPLFARSIAVGSLERQKGPT
jgi:hypothetical protein